MYIICKSKHSCRIENHIKTLSCHCMQTNFLCFFITLAPLPDPHRPPEMYTYPIIVYSSPPPPHPAPHCVLCPLLSWLVLETKNSPGNLFMDFIILIIYASTYHASYLFVSNSRPSYNIYQWESSTKHE